MTIRKINLMHAYFGKADGHSCKECSNFVSGRYNSRILRKCKVYGLTHSQASDWAGRNPACGMFNKEYHGNPMIELVRRGAFKKKCVEPMEGQLTLAERSEEDDKEFA